MADHLERIGQIMGDYRLIRWLGGGGFGNVYLAEHVRDSTQVANKVLQIRLTNHDDFRAFINEARMFRLRHPHIMPLLDFGLSLEDTPFLVMEYAPKGTLRHRYPKGERVSLLTVVEYATQVSSALQYAHDQHLVHRDVKPENMLLRDDEVILLSDFGIATAAHSTHSLSANHGIGGTVPYMAPEQLEGKPRSASDQYALGVVIYEWLAGRCPFQGTAVEVAMQHAMKPPPSLVEQVPELPREVEAVLFKALAKDYKERFVSMQAFITALQQASAPPTFRLPTPPVLDKLPSNEFSIISALPASPLPPEVGDAIIASSSVVQEPVTQVANSVTKTTAPNEMKQPESAYTPQNHPTMTPTNAHVTPLASKHSLSKRYRALLFAMVLLLIGGGSYAYLAVTHKDSTVTVRLPIIASYNAEVAKYGIMFGFNAQHTRNNPYEHILNVTNVSQLHQAWAVRTGDVVYSSPVVANGVVYVGDWDHNLYAFDVATGQQKWAASTGNTIYSSPAVTNGLIYVGSFDFNLYAFDVATGQQKWVIPTGGAIYSSPAVANGVVYVDSEDDKLYAFDAATGQQKWVTPANNIAYSSPAVANGVVYVGAIDHYLYAFDAITGQQKWATHTPDIIDSSPVVANGVVYVGDWDHNLYAFDAVTGQQKWVASTEGAITSSPAVANGVVYVGSRDRNLYAFDAATGQQKWAAPTSDAITSSPLVANGLVYIGCWNAKLYAFDAATGQQKWAASTGHAIESSPAVANGVVYVGSGDHKLYAFSL